MLGKTKTSDTSQTGQRCLCTQPFFSNNQLAKESSDGVAPVVVATLASTLDKSLKSDRSCVCSEHCATYSDRISNRTMS